MAFPKFYFPDNCNLFGFGFWPKLFVRKEIGIIFYVFFPWNFCNLKVLLDWAAPAMFRIMFREGLKKNKVWKFSRPIPEMPLKKNNKRMTLRSREAKNAWKALD